MSEEQLMAHLGLPLKPRLPGQGWREEKLSLVFIVMPHKDLGKWKENEFLVLQPAVLRCLYKLRVLGNGCHFRGVQFSGTGALQSCKQPVVFVDQVTSLTQHNLLHGHFSFCSVSMVYIPWLPWPTGKQVQCVSILPLISVPSPHHV